MQEGQILTPTSIRTREKTTLAFQDQRYHDPCLQPKLLLWLGHLYSLFSSKFTRVQHWLSCCIPSLHGILTGSLSCKLSLRNFSLIQFPLCCIREFKDWFCKEQRCGHTSRHGLILA